LTLIYGDIDFAIITQPFYLNTEFFLHNILDYKTNLPITVSVAMLLLSTGFVSNSHWNIVTPANLSSTGPTDNPVERVLKSPSCCHESRSFVSFTISEKVCIVPLILHCGGKIWLLLNWYPQLNSAVDPLQITLSSGGFVILTSRVNKKNQL